MKDLTVDTVKPNDFDISHGLIGSPFRNTEKEIIAKNIIMLSRLNNDKWLSFTWEEYQEKCSHRPTSAEKEILDRFVAGGFLKIEDGIYSIQDKFIATLEKFIR